MESKLNSDLIRKALKEKHITQIEFAKMLGITQSAISHYLSGRVKPTKENINKISEILNIKIDDLFIYYKNNELSDNDGFITEYTCRLLNELDYRLDLLKYDINIKQNIRDIILHTWGVCSKELKENKRINTLCPDAPVEEIPVKYIVHVQKLDGTIENIEFKSLAEYNAYLKTSTPNGSKTSTNDGQSGK